MRPPAVLLLALLLGGCASQAPPRSVSYQEAPAGALAFDPPILAGTPRLDLSREDRGPAAFAGFVESTTTVYDLRVDDCFGDGYGGFGGGYGGCGGYSGGNRDYYNREASSETVTVLHR